MTGISKSDWFEGREGVIVVLEVVSLLVGPIGMIVQSTRQRRRQKAAAEAEARDRTRAATQKRQEIEDLLGKYAKR